MHDESPADLRRAMGASADTAGGRHRRRRAGERGDRSCSSSTRSSTGTRAFLATSPRARRRSGCSAICWRRLSTRTSARGGWRRWRPRSRGRPCGGLPSWSGFPPAAAGCWSAAATWRTSSASSPPARPRRRWDVRKEGLSTRSGRLLVYASTETHTWIQKAADLFGLGTDAIRWIATDDEQRMDIAALRAPDRGGSPARRSPFLVVGTAGSVSTGVVDPLSEIAAHLPAPGVVVPRGRRLRRAGRASRRARPASLRALAEADSVAVDPHKWLYAPLEAGCALVRGAEELRDAFSYHPAYYHFDDQVANYFDYGPQNSRGFRALKVWLAMRQVGRAGYLKMIGDDILLARHLHRAGVAASGVRGDDAESQHHDVSLCAAGPEARARIAEDGGISRPAESGVC